MKIDKHIEIVGTNNPRLSAMAASSRQTILSVLRKHYTRVSITIVDDMADLEMLVAKKPDLVILGMKLILLNPTLGYEDSPKVWLSAYLDEHGIAFTGSDADAMALQLDKHVAKQKVLDAGLQSSAYFISSIDKPSFLHELTFPLFVKPANRGGSSGIDEQSVVYTDTELQAKIISLHDKYSSDVLIEEYLVGREFSVAVIKQQDSGELIAMPIEITAPADTQGNMFLSAAVKEADLEKVIVLDDPLLKGTVGAFAIDAFEALSSRDFGRIDMRLDANGVPSFIEANLMPGLSNHGYLFRCLNLNAGTTYDDMILSIVGVGLERSLASSLPVMSAVDTVQSPQLAILSSQA
jgi:D-alanine-D-alanine ligase